jgi:TPR repeat protein
MKKLIISLLTVLSFSCADDAATEQQITEYEDKAMYHQFITKEYELALGYHKKACELNSGVACANVASMYWNGNVKHTRNKEKIFEYYEKGCDLYNAYACSAIAMSYIEGWFDKPNYAKSLHYCLKAYRLGDTKACDMLDTKTIAEITVICTSENKDECNDIGAILGKRGELDKALKLYKQTCDLNSSMGCSNLGYMYLNGLAITKDFTIARRCLQKSCDLNNSNGCLNLGVMYEKGLGAEANNSKALTVFDKACNLGTGFACAEASRVSYIMGDEHNATLFSVHGCHLNNARACYALGYASDYGQGIMRKDRDEALIWYKKSCSLGLGRSCFVVAKRYEENSIKQDKQKAKEYYEKACKLHDEKACNILGLPTSDT